MIIEREMRFSKRFSDEFNVPFEKILPFFQNEFQSCLIGKADLKTELQKHLKEWNWNKSTDELLKYWFGHEGNINKKMLSSVENLRKSGIKCFLNTQNEKYLVEYVFEKIGLKKYFDGIFFTCEIGYLKSQQEYWETIYKKLGSPDKKSILCWDDEEKNIIAAREFGFSAELYKNYAEYNKKINNYLHKI